MTPTQQLVDEHKVILTLLAILEKIAENIQNGKKVDQNDLKDILEFIQVFADRCHHAKEEKMLFAEMEKAGFPKDVGPISVMLSEHKQGRSFVKKMKQGLESRPINEKIFAKNARAYAALLEQHIDKENNILYPLAENQLSKETQRQLLQNFDQFEEKEIGPNKHGEFHRLIDQLSRKYL